MRTPAFLRALGTATAALLAATLLATPAHAAKPSSPKRFTGYAFDTCVSPSDAVMDAWNVASPYAVVGIYTSGNSRYCDDSKQPYLSPAWVKRQANRGWLFMPIHVGHQAPCFASSSKKKMSYDIATARKQGRANANEAVNRAAHFGFARGNAVYLDIEWYDRSKASCNAAVLAFIDSFVARAHAKGYKVGLYSSASAAIQAVDAARHQGRSMHYPDQMWFAWTNKVANTNGKPYLQDTFWKKDRLHQFHNNVTVSYAGQKVLIDKNVLEVGGGSRAKKEKKVCGMSPTLSRYRNLKPGKRGTDVRLLQCLLRKAGHKVTVNKRGKWNKSTTRAVRSHRVALGMSRKPLANQRVWTALISRGSTPIALKRGKTGEPVHRLQRSLVAAGQSVKVTGVFDARTAKAVKAYRKRVDLPTRQTADRQVWAALQRGRR